MDVFIPGLRPIDRGAHRSSKRKTNISSSENFEGQRV